jgi:hypothetical protein
LRPRGLKRYKADYCGEGSIYIVDKSLERSISTARIDEQGTRLQSRVMKDGLHY